MLFMLAVVPSASLLASSYDMARMRWTFPRPRAFSEAGVTMMAEPFANLEAQQRAVIRILMNQLGMQGSADEVATLDAILVAGDTGTSGRLQKANEGLRDEISKWNLHMTWAQEQVKSRDALTERVAAAKKEVAEAEARVEPLKVECKRLDLEVSKATKLKVSLGEKRMQCERTLVTLPAEITKLRDTITAIEVELEELQPAVDMLAGERLTLIEDQARLVSELANSSALLSSLQKQCNETSLRVEELTSATAETSEAIASSELKFAQLSSEELELETAYEPLCAALSAAQVETIDVEERTSKFRRRNDTLAANLSESSAALATSKAACELARSELKQARIKLVSMRKERKACAIETDAAQLEINESEELAASLLSEMETLKIEAPALFARRNTAKTEVEEALAAVERFESEQMAATLALDSGEGEGASLDEQIVATGLQLERATEEVDGRMRALSQFSETVVDAMETASARRDSAQRALELLSAEQRRASEEMKQTMSTALKAMEAMQGQWDAAVSANAAELRELKAGTSAASEKQRANAVVLERRRADLAAQALALRALAQERQTLSEEEETLRDRYDQLRARRLAKLRPAQPAAQTSTTSQIPLAEAAGANAEKAAVALLRFFGNKDGKDGS